MQYNKVLVLYGNTMAKALAELFPIHVLDGEDNPEDYRHSILFGIPHLNHPGMLNHPEIPILHACYKTNLRYGNVVWYKIISTALQSLEVLTDGVESPDSLLLPYELNASAMLLKYLHEGGIKNIDVLPELGKATMPLGDTALFYAKDASKFEIVIDSEGCKVVLYRPFSLAMLVNI